MKIIVHVQASEFVKRRYEINVGAGQQFISWLATTACLQFGQEHYPNGIYVPNLLTKKDDDIPHPRNRIKEEFADGDECTVLLKDRSLQQDEEMKLWYDRAFGPQRNIMRISCIFRPGDIIKMDPVVFVELHYDMYDEMQDEFNKEDYPKVELLEMEFEYNDNDKPQKEWFLDIDRPYGKFEAICKYRSASAEEGSEEYEPVELDSDKLKGFFRARCEPEPISAKDQERLDMEEEEDNKRKEHEARLAQKKLEEEKAKIRVDKQQQILKQEQNSAKLKVYFRAMNLSFHKQEEDFNASMSLLSIYHLELHENFQFYASALEPYYKRRENEMIPLQGFFNFIKLMRLAQSTSQVIQFFDSLKVIEGITMPIDDTLNIKNGLNYAQFLEALLRIGYIKTEQNEDNKTSGAFKNTLESIFNNAQIDIQKRTSEDPLLQHMYNQETNSVFYTFSELLCTIYTNESQGNAGTYPEMSKQKFIQVLEKAGVIKKPVVEKKQESNAKGGKKNEKKEEAQQEEQKAPSNPADLFNADDVLQAIQPVQSFESDQMDYYNFLEALMRTANRYPFTKEQQGEMQTFDQKLDWLIQQLDGAFRQDIPRYQANRVANEQKFIYQPRTVVDDEEEDLTDEDDD